MTASEEITAFVNGETEPQDDDNYCESLEEFRRSGIPTGLPAEYSRHYESIAVARLMPSGRWVGWTYWFGGGKHGEPSGMPWLEDAYYVEMHEVMEPVKKFAKRRMLERP